eukprot:NODE_1120_length_1690_cov_38.269348_g991_i0.p1 GENE.NODE_1120_length_1690_cov_38.269348_g991_i0~~NODE_1120_length_1690_cov_38.269348_g991_i0.p1  ORF type:complete len:329 (+),score=42.39 NODE_1120_length_1690_cov_38.269348_g991_i0:58-1044(+)
MLPPWLGQTVLFFFLEAAHGFDLVQTKASHLHLKSCSVRETTVELVHPVHRADSDSKLLILHSGRSDEATNLAVTDLSGHDRFCVGPGNFLAPQWYNSTHVLTVSNNDARFETRDAHGNPSVLLVNMVDGTVREVRFQNPHLFPAHHWFASNVLRSSVMLLRRRKIHGRFHDWLDEVGLIDGRILWSWNHSAHGLGSYLERGDVHHTNGIYWDIEQNVIYLTVRMGGARAGAAYDSRIVVIRYPSGKLLWGLHASSGHRLTHVSSLPFCKRKQRFPLTDHKGGWHRMLLTGHRGEAVLFNNGDKTAKSHVVLMQIRQHCVKVEIACLR